MQSQFACPSAEEIAGCADDVADIQKFIQRINLLADRVFLDVDLQAFPVLGEMKKACFAHAPVGPDASGDAHFHALFQFFGRFVAELSDDFWN